MTISNHVNFEKLLLKIFDTKYKSIEGGWAGFAQAIVNGMFASRRRIWANDVVLKERNPKTGIKEAVTESYGINIIMSRYNGKYNF